MDDPGFDDRYVLYFDFLGTRAAATTWPRDRLHRFVDLLISISQIQAQEAVSGGAQTDGSYRIEITPEKKRPSPYLWPDIILKDAIRVAAVVAEAALRIGLVLRGGFSVGQLFHDGDVVFGAALVEAYELESKFAQTPRVLVADGVMERLKPMKPKDTGSLLRDADGRWHLDYFTRMMRNAAPEWDPSLDPVESLSPENRARMEADLASTSRWKRDHLGSDRATDRDIAQCGCHEGGGEMGMVQRAISMGDQPNSLIGVFIDHNVWHLLFDLRLDLAAELPRPEFRLGITREAEFEIAATAAADPELKAYIDDTIARCGITTDTYFGFHAESLPQDEQRIGGFGLGRWASPRELEFIASQERWLRQTKRKTKLYANEADISLAARSFATSSAVLTCDRKAGPLRDAFNQHGKIVYMNDFAASGLSLRDYIKAAL